MTPDELRVLPRPLAFVLPGGGALGAHQVGTLAALAAAGIEPDLLVGVSAGAVNAAFYAWNPGVDGVRRVDAIWRSLRRRDLLRVHPGRLALAFAGFKPSFLDNRHGHRFLRRHFGGRRLDDAPVPLAVVATDLGTGEAVTLRTGPAVPALLASTAFPGVYPPVWLGERWLVDGGVVNDVPLDVAADMGAKSALVLQLPPLASAADPPRRAIGIVLRAGTLGVEAHGRTVLRRPPEGLATVELACEPTTLTTFSVGTAGDVIDHAYESARAWLATPATGSKPSP